MKPKLLIPLLLLVALLVFQPAHAQLGTGNIQTQTDISGTGATVAICATCNQAKWVQITALATNTGVARWGDSNTSSSRGAAIAAGGGQYLPTAGGPYYLPQMYVYVANGDKLTITWAY